MTRRRKIQVRLTDTEVKNLEQLQRLLGQDTSSTVRVLISSATLRLLQGESPPFDILLPPDNALISDGYATVPQYA